MLLHHLWELFPREFETACRDVDNWLSSGLYAGDEEKARAIVNGWAWADLVDRIFRSLLEARGVDLDEVEDRVLSAPAGVTAADVVATYMREVR